METWIALFRGINVGGNNNLPMASLRKLLEDLGCENVRTYIQSGNAVFDSKSKSSNQLSTKISHAIEAEHGFRPWVYLMQKSDLQAAIDANPFPQGIAEPTSLHFFFLSEPAKLADLNELDAIRKPNEAFLLSSKVFYLYAPDGVSQSKLAAKAERLLKVATTARNYRTVEKLVSIA